jgi:hypothetical protein
MEIRTRNIRELAHRCEEFLDDGKPLSISYPGSLALCILDALFTTGSHPTAIDNVVDRYVVKHGSADGAKSLRYSIAAAGGAEVWAREVIYNLKPAHVRPGAMLRAEVVDRATRLMADHGIDTVDDLLAAVGDGSSSGAHPSELAQGWKALPSQRSGLSWRHLLAVAGSDHFEIDHRVHSYIAEVARPFFRTDDDYALALIAATADYLDVEVRVVNQIVWQVSHRRLHPDPKREPLDLPYGMFEDELEFDSRRWTEPYDPGVSEGAEGWSSMFEPEYRAVPFGPEVAEPEEDFEEEPENESRYDWMEPYSVPDTASVAPF